MPATASTATALDVLLLLLALKALILVMEGKTRSAARDGHVRALGPTELLIAGRPRSRDALPQLCVQSLHKALSTLRARVTPKEYHYTRLAASVRVTVV